MDAVTGPDLVHEAREVKLDGAKADVEFDGDLGVGPALSDGQCDVFFPVGQGDDWSGVLRGGRGVGEAGERWRWGSANARSCRRPCLSTSAPADERTFDFATSCDDVHERDGCGIRNSAGAEPSPIVTDLPPSMTGHTPPARG